MASLPPIANNPDVRLLGAMLGDVIRGYAGDGVYEKVEAIRRAAVERARTKAGEEPALPALDPDDSVAVVRAFMLYSMLANLAEDRQGVAAEEGATLAEALDRLAAEGIDAAAVRALLDKALIAPVLTAHPTEVRRKSMIDHRNRIAMLLGERDAVEGAGDAETADGDLIDDAIRRQIALLWQTRALRRERLGVADEVETALSYLRDVFMPTLPALYQRWDRALGERTPSFLRPGSWIGGDRDGNPFVTADGLRIALGRAAEATIGQYLDAVHALGAELSIASGQTPVDDGLAALADAAGDRAPSRQDEPFRRALSGVHARLAATYRELTGSPAPRPGRLTGEPYAGPDEFRVDLVVIARALASARRGRAGERGRARPAGARGRPVRLPPRHARSAAEFRRS